MSNVVVLDMETRLPLPPERILDAAKEWVDPDQMTLVLAYNKETGEAEVACSRSELGEILLLLERAKAALPI